MMQPKEPSVGISGWKGDLGDVDLKKFNTFYRKRSSD